MSKALGFVRLVISIKYMQASPFSMHKKRRSSNEDHLFLYCNSHVFLQFRTQKKLFCLAYDLILIKKVIFDFLYSNEIKSWSRLLA